MEAFNNALLANQVWRLIKDSNLLVARLLRAKYFSNSDIFKAALRIVLVSLGTTSMGLGVC